MTLTKELPANQFAAHVKEYGIASLVVSNDLKDYWKEWDKAAKFNGAYAVEFHMPRENETIIIYKNSPYSKEEG